MNFSKLLYSLLTLMMGLCFMVLGTIGLLALWYPQIRTNLIVFVLENAWMISISSVAIFAIGAAMLIHVIQSTKHRYYLIPAGRHLVSVDESLIENYLSNYWKELFPKLSIPNHVTLKQNRIYIIADLPYFSAQEQKILLGKIDKDVSKILQKILGYNREFSLQISFNESNKSS